LTNVIIRDHPNGQPILDLLHLCFADMEGRINPPSSLHRLTANQITQHSSTETILTIEIDEVPIACLFVTDQPDCLYLGKLAVHPDHRGKNYAAILIGGAEQIARICNIQTLRLQTRIELTENHAIFAHLGFAKTAEGRHPGFNRTTEITMEKPV
jgi:GNAT superfamily N-acetyltransferase